MPAIPPFFFNHSNSENAKETYINAEIVLYTKKALATEKSLVRKRDKFKVSDISTLNCIMYRTRGVIPSFKCSFFSFLDPPRFFGGFLDIKPDSFWHSFIRSLRPLVEK